MVGRRFPIAVGDFGFNVFIDRSLITASSSNGTGVNATQEALDALESDLNKVYPRTFILSRLSLTLDEFERDLTLAKVPVYVFASLVVIIVLYFLALITGILGRSQADELSLLRGRGASVPQVCGVLLLAEGALALAAVAVGPPLAWAIVRFLLLPTFGELGGGAIELSLSADAFWMGALGAALSVAVLTASAAGRARAGVADAMSSRSRPPSVSFFHRYYLDLLVVLAAGLLWWQFRERDGFLSRSLESRGLDLDPSLILGPVLGLLAAALLLMRALPLLARLVVWLLMRAGPGWSSVALARLARDPVLPSSLAVMLMLAAALGVYGATFQSSVSRSQSDQAQYRLGRRGRLGRAGSKRQAGPGTGRPGRRAIGYAIAARYGEPGNGAVRRACQPDSRRAGSHGPVRLVPGRLRRGDACGAFFLNLLRRPRRWKRGIRDGRLRGSPDGRRRTGSECGWKPEAW